MPELPEVEHLRRGLEPHLSSARLVLEDVSRPELLRSIDGRRVETGRVRPRAALRAALLDDATVARLHRHGKELAIEATDGRVLVVGLGMTGALLVERDVTAAVFDHRHLRWRIERADGVVHRLTYRDPRRFGRLHAFRSLEALEADRWSNRGIDALDGSVDALADVIATSRASMKATLLDQLRIAGVGNIYADEALHAARIDPRRRGNAIRRDRARRLAQAIRLILLQAVQAGGSSIRDYRDAAGAPGSFQARHAVYGRAGKPCLRCGTRLRTERLAGRATVWCGRCQRA